MKIGQAFPRDDFNGVEGMTLRQYYIGQALAGIMANPACCPTVSAHYTNIAGDAIRAADAVLLLDGDSK